LQLPPAQEDSIATITIIAATNTFIEQIDNEQRFSEGLIQPRLVRKTT
jgi:hypothetical protein